MSSRYQIQGEINQGGVGVVLRAWDTRLQRAVAIKRCLEPALRSDFGAVDPDLMREATVLSAMQHPHIVSIYDVIADDPAGPCVVMEYLNGKNLEQAVAHAAITRQDFLQIAGQTLDALGNAHRLNLLHRDIKPSNLQMTWLADGQFLCKFVDFGLARFFQRPSRQTVRVDGTVMGSVYYMAPEQLERRPLDGRTDLYSLGCVFYYLLTMHRPFEGATVQEVIAAHLQGRRRPLRDFRPDLEPRLCQWVEWLMACDPAHRPGSAGEAWKELQLLLPLPVPAQNSEEEPLPGLPPSQLEPEVPRAAWPRRRSARGWFRRRKPAPVLPAFGAAALLSLATLGWDAGSLRPTAVPPAGAAELSGSPATGAEAAPHAVPLSLPSPAVVLVLPP